VCEHVKTMVGHSSSTRYSVTLTLVDSRGGTGHFYSRDADADTAHVVAII